MYDIIWEFYLYLYATVTKSLRRNDSGRSSAKIFLNKFKLYSFIITIIRVLSSQIVDRFEPNKSYPHDRKITGTQNAEIYTIFVKMCTFNGYIYI